MTRYQTICLDDGTAARLDGLCAASGRSPSEVVRLAIVAMHVRDHIDQGAPRPTGGGDQGARSK